MHLAKLDIQQHSEVHLSALSELFRNAGIHDGFASLTESEKIILLRQELANPRPLAAPGTPLSEQTEELLRKL